LTALHAGDTVLPDADDFFATFSGQVVRVAQGNTVKALMQFAVLIALCLWVNSLASAAEDDFTGTWDTRTDKGRGYEITFLQEGHHVTGTYVVQNGRRGHIDGTVDGNVLQFKWEQDGGDGGTGEFALSTSGIAFNGTYRADGNTRQHDASLQGVWSGVRRLR
jgi:hypothetical protein